jgi:hypothetical protein
MSLTLVVYPPGAGGNHLKNLLCLSSYYANSGDLDPAVYLSPAKTRAVGEVWCVGGRNLQDIFFQRMTDNPTSNWVLPAHFGEMIQFRDQINQQHHKKIIVLTIENQATRRELESRQTRLGQHIHPYWLDEELVGIYQPETLSKVFKNHTDQYISLGLDKFWAENFVTGGEFNRVQSWLNIDLSIDTAEQFHALWRRANFK